MRPAATRLLWAGVALTAALTVGVGVSHAQQIWSGGYGGYTPPRFPTATTFKGAFNFCRLMFTSNRREKGGWSTDYPGADINFSIRLGELTRTRVSRINASEGSDPDFVVVRPTDPGLFQCPFVLVEDGGTAHFTEQEVIGLRAYLQKGGFILASDYWGTPAREQWDEEIGRVLPPAHYPIADIPKEHPVWHTEFDVDHVPQMASIQFWRATGGGTSQRGADSTTVDVRGIADEHGRLMVLMLHNTDIPDGWEREGEDPAYFYLYSPDAYAVGIDVLLYTMTH